MLDMTECCWFYLNCLTNKICPFSAIIVVLYIMNWIVTYYLIRRYISMYPCIWTWKRPMISPMTLQTL
jgi:hypothetical protein